jgi:8-oxo-dGTP diphosphatase
MRSAVVIVRGVEIALIQRIRGGAKYYLFPGGQVEPGESIEGAARREALEELGVEVELGQMVAERTSDPRQVFFSAKITGGHFGSGLGVELSSPENSERGSYTPVWIPIGSLDAIDIRPKSLADSIVEDPRLSDFVEVAD